MAGPKVNANVEYIETFTPLIEPGVIEALHSGNVADIRIDSDSRLEEGVPWATEGYLPPRAYMLT